MFCVCCFWCVKETIVLCAMAKAHVLVTGWERNQVQGGVVGQVGENLQINGGELHCMLAVKVLSKRIESD